MILEIDLRIQVEMRKCHSCNLLCEIFRSFESHSSMNLMWEHDIEAANRARSLACNLQRFYIQLVHKLRSLFDDFGVHLLGRLPEFKYSSVRQEAKYDRLVSYTLKRQRGAHVLQHEALMARTGRMAVFYESLSDTLGVRKVLS
jgi:hypothetical protein